MKKKVFVFPAFLLGAAVVCQAQTAAPAKIGIIHVQAAILGTKEGQKAAADINAKFSPRQADLEKKKANIDSLEEQLRKGSATMSDGARSKLTRDIDEGKKNLQRDSEDAQADLEQEEGKIYNQLGAKLYQVVDKYAKANGFALIIDVSPQTQPVFWAADAVNITNEIIALYDKANSPAAGAVPPAPPKSAPPAAAPKSGAAPAAPPKQ